MTSAGCDEFSDSKNEFYLERLLNPPQNYVKLETPKLETKPRFCPFLKPLSKIWTWKGKKLVIGLVTWVVTRGAHRAFPCPAALSPWVRPKPPSCQVHFRGSARIFGSLCRYQKALYFWYLGIRLYLEKEPIFRFCGDSKPHRKIPTVAQGKISTIRKCFDLHFREVFSKALISSCSSCSK